MLISDFERLYVSKLDDDGKVKTYQIKDLDKNGEVKNVKILSYLRDIYTGDLYIDEPWYVVSVKCACVAAANPFYSLGRLSWDVFKLPIKIAIYAAETFFNNAAAVWNRDPSQVLSHTHLGACKILSAVDVGLWEIICDPFYALAIEATSLYGILDPFDGRKYEAIVERSWQNNASFRNDLRDAPSTLPNTWQAFVNDIENGRPFYLAHCFQVRHNSNDPKVASKMVIIKRGKDLPCLNYLPVNGHR